MINCPLCHAEIDELDLTVFLKATVNRDYKVTYDAESSSLEKVEVPDTEETEVDDVLEETYYCPVCGGELAEGCDEAWEILSGRKEE